MPYVRPTEPVRTLKDGRQFGVKWFNAEQRIGWYVVERDRDDDAAPWEPFKGPFNTRCEARNWIKGRR